MVLLRQDSRAPVVAIVTHVSAGYFDEPDEISGIAHVLEHMYFKGTPRRGVGAIARETKARGGYLNAHTIYDHTAYFTVLPSSALEAGLDIQSDAYRNSSIDAGELGRELEVIIQEARRKLDTPSAVAVESLYALMHDRHRIRRWRIGTEEGLRRLTRDDLVGFYRAHYTPQNTVVSVVGDAKTSTMLQLVTRYYGDDTGAERPRDRGPVETGESGFRVREWDGDIAQTQIVLGWRTPPLAHNDTVALDVLGMVLGTGRASRLYRAVRDKQLASSVSASNYTPIELGVFNIHAETQPASAGAALDAIWEQVHGVARHGIAEQELDRAKNILVTQWLRRCESMDGQAVWLAFWESLGGWRKGEEYFSSVLALEPAEIKRVASEYLSTEEVSIAVYRPRGTEPIADGKEKMKARLSALAPSAEPLRPDHIRESAVFARRRPRLEQVCGKTRVFRTDNGVPILVRRNPGSPLVHASFHVSGGVVEEDAAAGGLTLLMARAAIKGTEFRSAATLADDLELQGASLSPSIGLEGFGWSLSGPLRSLDSMLEILSEVTLKPVFPDDMLETERSVAAGELAMIRDDMYRFPMRLAMEAAYPGHVYSRSTHGDEKTLAGVARAAVSSWHRRKVLSGPVTLGIVGDVDEDELAAKLATVFFALEGGTLTQPASPVWPATPQERSESREKAQTAMAIALPSVDRGSERRFASDMIATIGSGLGGRFFEELRDKQSLAYTVHAFPIERRLAGAFVGYIATAPEKEESAMTGLLREFEKLAEAPVSAEELDQAREYTIGSRAIRLQSGGAMLSEMMDAYVYGSGLEELEEMESRIRSVTAAEMLQFARDHFDSSRRAVGIVRGKPGRS